MRAGACFLHGLCWGVQHARRVCKQCIAACMDRPCHERIIHRFPLLSNLCMQGILWSGKCRVPWTLVKHANTVRYKPLPSVLGCVQVHTFQKDSQNLSITWCSLAGTCPDALISRLMSTQRATGCVTLLSSALAAEQKAASKRPSLWCTSCSHLCTGYLVGLSRVPSPHTWRARRSQPIPEKATTRLAR